ncbi:hypothetical protein AJ80_06449 [Polytolypa hystricis UAMH7299]|uniref:GPI ethanolamine phosphate transferase 2 n=1 Tax=Polytolypa hystricis (strain UAMH7299) TaxID=1447883 RepID=A0A2B7XWN7_POLH7|nr:hypothetical protein AJ80_06449 [Polytolypa hystricis UAMH7299]
MAAFRQKLSLAIANLLLPLALVLFASGFFPYKPILSGLAVFEDGNNVAPATAPFDKVVFMVVDALRSDFVYAQPSGFEFTQELIRSGSAIPFTAHAGAPTVTMPRVKAITTGSVPSFLDVILNIAESDKSSSLVYQDSWLAQLRARPGGRLVMYGDDTWLKLFPDFFDRHDGTTSFFVSDFVEVDNNVTRHVSEELLMDDWSGFIMHYLGLDHIGHKTGPKSLHMVPKQQEMDAIVKEVYNAMIDYEHLNSTLLVLCGDHGMNEAGNHGGASSGETSAALTFISPKLQQIAKNQKSPLPSSDNYQFYNSVDQSDIAPTLAGLLGFPIPLNSLGGFMSHFLPLWQQDSERLALLQNNARQLLNVVKTTFPGHAFDANSDPCDAAQNSDLDKLECQWYSASKLVQSARDDGNLASETESALLGFLKSAQGIMSSTASSYDLSRLYLGSALASIAVVLSFMSSFQTLARSPAAGMFTALIIVSYSAMMFGSSYVEEEQQFWYWVLSGWVIYLYVRSYPHSRSGFPISPILFAVLSRIVRRWNQTGQKFAAEPDITTGFLRLHPNILWVLVLFTYVDVCQRLMRRISRNSPSSMILSVYPALVSFAFIFKIAFTAADSPELLQGSTLLQSLAEAVQGISLVIQARVVFVGIGLALVYSTVTSLRGISHTKTDRKVLFSNLKDILTLFLLTQAKTTNIPLYLLFHQQESLLSSMYLSGLEISITSLILQYASFFALGGSNSISSVDLSNAYNGISSFNVVVVGLLTFVGNWAGPIWWVLATHELFIESDNRRSSNGSSKDRRRLTTITTNRSHHLGLLTLFVSTNILGVMLACTVLRAHLFIWTVFSPKFLYCSAWSVAHHLVVNILWGEGIMWSL